MKKITLLTTLITLLTVSPMIFAMDDGDESLRSQNATHSHDGDEDGDRNTATPVLNVRPAAAQPCIPTKIIPPSMHPFTLINAGIQRNRPQQLGVTQRAATLQASQTVPAEHEEAMRAIRANHAAQMNHAAMLYRRRQLVEAAVNAQIAIITRRPNDQLGQTRTPAVTSEMQNRYNTAMEHSKDKRQTVRSAGITSARKPNTTPY